MCHQQDHERERSDHADNVKTCAECETTNSLLKHCARAFLQVSSIEEQGCSDALKTVELIQENTRPYSQHASLLELHSSAVGAWKTIETAGADLSHNSVGPVYPQKRRRT